MLKRLFPFIIALLAFPFLTKAQVTTSSMTGTVKDADGQALTGATISAVHQPTGTRYTTVTRSGGNFIISNMRPGGPYTVQITYVGHTPAKYDDVFLRLAEATVLTGTLEKTGGTLQNVVITGTGGGRNNLLNANRTGAVTNIGAREIQRLPSVTRSLNDFLRITPQSNGAYVGGGNYRQNFITVDGSDFNNTFGIGNNLPAGGSPISLDAIEEMSVSITPYDIRQSGFIGSAVNAVTRSGSNNFSASVYSYWRNQFQQGNKVAKQTFAVQPLKYNQYGARVGGPIINNKLFYFINFETEQQISPGQSKFAATSAAPFGSASNIARPTTTELDNISNYLRTTYGYETGAYQGYDFPSNKEKLLARIDWNVTSKHRLNVRYSQVESKTPFFASTSLGSTGVTGVTGNRGDINSLTFKNSNYFQEANFYSLAGELNSSFGKVTNTLRASYTHQNDPRSTESTIFPFVDIMKDNLFFTSFGYEPFSFGNLRDVATYSYIDNLTWNLNKHNITLGAQLDQSLTKNGFQPLGTSYYRFASFDDFKNGVKPLDFAQTFSLSPNFEQAYPSFKFKQFSMYLQDEISLSSKFKLTLGLRADQTSYPNITELKTNPLLLGLTFAGGQKINTGNLPATKTLFSPRLGFNWDVTGDRSLQVRGGTGVFTGRVPFVWIVGQSGNSGMIQVTQNFNGQANTPGAFNQNPGAYRPATVPAAGTVIPSSVTAFSEGFKSPSVWKSSLAFDKKLGAGFVLSMEAIFNRDINTLYSKNINLVDPQPLNVAGYVDNRLIYPNATASKYINKLTAAGVPSAAGTSALTAVVSGNAEKKGYYFSFTTKLEKQFSKGFFGSVAYIYSASDNLYDGEGDQPVNTWNLIPHVNGANFETLAPSAYVVPSRVVATVSYRREYIKHLATTISLYYEGASDGRFSYTYAGDFNRDGATSDLIYIPKNASEITFVPLTIGSGASAVTYSAADQSARFFAYVAQDKYLSKHQGEYAERNGALLPWRHRVDAKFVQEIFSNLGGKRNSLQFSIDITNLANLLNSDWGKIKVVNSAQILTATNISSLVAGGTVKPTFTLANDRGTPVSATFRDLLTTAGTYSMQFGLRYNFN